MRKGFLTTLLVACSATAFGQAKKTVSVDPFDYSAVMTDIQSIFGTQQNIGIGIQAMMVRRVQQGGRFTVVERRKVNDIMREQNFAAGNRVKKGTGARIGEIKGAQFTLMGDIVVFGRDDRQERKSGGLIVLGVGSGGSKYLSESKAVVVLNFRMVDVETSEVVASGEARGESKRISKGGGSAFIAGFVAVGGAYNINTSNFAETIIGEATMDAVDKLGAQLNGAALTGGADRTADLDARIADVSGQTIIINAGSAAGLQAGQSFTVYHKGKEVKDPTTGEVLDVQATAIGKITLNTIRERISIGTYSGSTQPVVGDVVRP